MPGGEPLIYAVVAAAIAAPLAEVDLHRIAPDHPRVFVVVRLADGSDGLFLVDTGADTSAISAGVAERLGLEVEVGCGELAGLSGTARMDCATMSTISIGDAEIPGVDVAVDVPGIAANAGFVPLDGLLGNNVWGRFVLEVDTVESRLRLHAPDAVVPPRRAQPLHFDGHHVYTPMRVQPAGVRDRSPPFVGQVDTGAGGLKVCARTGARIGGDWTQGLETVRGIGAADTLPPYRFLQETRRIPLKWVDLGGRRIRPTFDASWVDFEADDRDVCESGMRALSGYEMLQGHRVWFAYAAGAFWLEPVRGAPRFVDAHAAALTRDVALYGEEPGPSALGRARLLIGLERLDEAATLLEEAEPLLPVDDVGTAKVLRAELRRISGDVDAADALFATLEPGVLADEGELVAEVNRRVLGGDVAGALAMAQAATTARPEEPEAWVALSDAALASGDLADARSHLLEAVELTGYPDAHLLRRARVALTAGDRFGAMTHLRKLLQLYPFGGTILWFYAQLCESEGDRETLERDMAEAFARLHPGDVPRDFEIAVLHRLGDKERTRHRLDAAREELCGPIGSSAEADNCVAWLLALAHEDLDEAAQRIARALTSSGPRSDFLDTAAMVHFARGDLDHAAERAREAASLAPSDVYMLWQAERLSTLAAAARP